MLSVFYEMFGYGMYSIFISLVHFVRNILRVLHCLHNIILELKIFTLAYYTAI